MASPCLSKGSLFAGRIEPETSIRKTRFVVGRPSFAISQPFRPTRSSATSSPNSSSRRSFFLDPGHPRRGSRDDRAALLHLHRRRATMVPTLYRQPGLPPPRKRHPALEANLGNDGNLASDAGQVSKLSRLSRASRVIGWSSPSPSVNISGTSSKFPNAPPSRPRLRRRRPCGPARWQHSCGLCHRSFPRWLGRCRGRFALCGADPTPSTHGHSGSSSWPIRSPSSP